MKRREFGKKFMVAGIGIGINRSKVLTPPAKILPKKLSEGDVVSLIAPGSPLADDKIEKAVSNLEKLGLKPKLGENIRKHNGYLAGTDLERLSDFENAFEDKETKAIWCARGGYGCTRILPNIDFKKIKKNPKVLIGYSDVTALLISVYQKTGLVTFHGPVGSSDFTEFTIQNLSSVLFRSGKNHEIKFEKVSEEAGTEYDPFIVKTGVSIGTLLGGNLSIVNAMAGTPDSIKGKENLLFLEDIGEKPYRLDRMFVQLRQSETLSKASGIVLGVFSDCEKDPEDENSFSLKEVIQNEFKNFAGPVVYGIPFGHVKDMCTLPVGVLASLNTYDGYLRIAEDTVMV
jgi:muramoyltetrapeptide carboxypeptidase